MQISGYSSMSEYYAELAKIRSQKAQNASSSSAAEIFGKTDSDESGSISKSEFASMFSQMQSTGASEGATATVDATASTEGVEKRPPPPPPPEMTTEELEELFAEADLDGNGELSLEEFSVLNEKMRPNQPEGAQQGAQAQGNKNNGSNSGSVQSLFALLQNNQSGFGNLTGSSSSNSFAELLNIFGGEGSSSSTSSSYIQSLVKSAYGA